MAEANSPDQDSTATTGIWKHPAHWDDLLTPRSVLFYDGTYTWDGTNGFWDDNGIHHDFDDPADPEAYPPTPRPVGLWLEDDGTQNAKDASGEMPALDDPDFALHHGTQESMHPTRLNIFSKFTQERPKATLIKDNVYRKTLLQDDLFVGHADLNQLVEGQYLSDSYKLCGMKIPSAVYTEANSYALNPARSAAADAKEADLSQGSPFGSSPFSDCPSDLSNWEIENQVKHSYSAVTPKTDPEHDTEVATHENREEDLKRPRKAKARSGSIDSAVDLPVKRRSTRLFLKN
ncbi:hypothetical protein SLS60_006253 [Paraconiothyrium brasiliense]|uniref:Uncharacterized protein n=1 Tax=Paraconiothyrium brasiliense TaxID=300254 RepID=A0ABR3RG43_9PLEO